MINTLIKVQIKYQRSSGEEDMISSCGDQIDLLGSHAFYLRICGIYRDSKCHLKFQEKNKYW